MIIPRSLQVLQDLSDEDLEKELAARKAKRAGPPTPLEKPDYSQLRQMIIGEITQACENCYQDDDFEHYVYEEAMKAVYGPDIFTWLNAQKWQ